MIGVIDFDKQKKARTSHNTVESSINYYAYQGYIYPGQKNSGSGALKVGDIITVTVNRK